MKYIELIAIETFYLDKTAARSKVPLINHIHEGLKLLHSMGASEKAKRAFCLHPLTQGDVMLPETCKDFDVITLAHQYASVANSYLCKETTDHIDSLAALEEHMSHICWNKDLIWMLMADKLQNQKDFLIYHSTTHPRSKQLDRYFRLWNEYLLTLL